VSGQDLVPVLEHDGLVMADSPAILRYLEELRPEPPLWPADPARRAELDVFVDWFNRVWKRPPNDLEAELRRAYPDRKRADALAASFADTSLFEALLQDRDFLFGNELSAADVTAFPFLKYALLWHEGDEELFHRILRDHLQAGDDRPQLTAWIRRVDALPRA
jgi:glutathione S-transferase